MSTETFCFPIINLTEEGGGDGARYVNFIQSLHQGKARGKKRLSSCHSKSNLKNVKIYIKIAFY